MFHSLFRRANLPSLRLFSTVPKESAHERLKKRIHAFRVPLGWKGRAFMATIYFCLPAMTGSYVVYTVQKFGSKDLQPELENLRTRSGRGEETAADREVKRLLSSRSSLPVPRTDPRVLVAQGFATDRPASSPTQSPTPPSAAT